MYSKRRSNRSTCWTDFSAEREVRRAADAPAHGSGVSHPLTRETENATLARYEQDVKTSFDKVEAQLRTIASMQHETDFVSRAQALATEKLGYELPAHVLEKAWVDPLDMRALYAWCIFENYRRWVAASYQHSMDVGVSDTEFAGFLQGCGYHYLDFTPCADGRLAHAVRYVLRLPKSQVRRRAHAGAMFDVEDSLEKWIEVEHSRHRESVPNAADAATHYLKVVMYHYCGSDPKHEGCAAHGSDDAEAAAAGLARLMEFKTAIESGFCCGASVDLLLIGIDTDTDAIRIHVPDANGAMSLGRYIDALDVYSRTRALGVAEARAAIAERVRRVSLEYGASETAPGMAALVAKLLENNMSQIDYVRQFHNGQYADIGHNERFIGTGAGFDELQLRNLTYFAYLKTVEEGATDLDVGVKIFSGLNVSRGLPIPVVVRFDYTSSVPHARERALERCLRVGAAVQGRYAQLRASGKLHVLMVIRDSERDGGVEIVGSTLAEHSTGVH